MDVLDAAPPKQAAEPRTAGGRPGSTRRLGRASLVVPATVVLLAAGLRMWGLSAPPQPYWDETYYVPDAYDYLGGGYLAGHPDDPSYKLAGEITWVHPPMGKWMIALGVGPIGLRPIGWRLPSALFGTAGVLLVYLLALALWGSVWWAGLAGLLLSLDGLHIVQSRIAMLDIFLSTFVLAAVYLMVLDRRESRRLAGSPRGPRTWVERTFGTRYRLGSGLALGAAVATKWSGAFALILVVALCAQALPGEERRLRTMVASFVVIPLLVYLAAYATWFAQNGLDVPRFLALHWRMLLHQLHHGTAQPENSSPLSWPFLAHPIRYDPPPGFPATGGGQIWLIGNPALWWGFLLALPVLVVKAARRRWKEIVILGAYLAMFLPWVFLGRTQFLFYMLPAVPFMCLGMVAGLRVLPPRTGARAAIVFAIVFVLTAAAYLPAWLGLGIRWIRLPLLS